MFGHSHSKNDEDSPIMIISEKDLPEPPVMTAGLNYRKEHDKAASSYNKISDVTYIDSNGNIMSI